MTEASAKAAIDTFLQEALGAVPFYDLEEQDESRCWAFWVLQDDTTSYVHPDGRIEWYGTAWEGDDA